MNKKRILSMIGLAALMSSAALADSAGTLTVSGTVVNTCLINSPTLAFGGTVATLGSANTDTSVDLTVACTSGASDPNILLDIGSHGSSGARRMVGATNGAFMNYSLYSGSVGGTAWPVGGSGVSLGQTPDGTNQTLTVYGRVPGGQTSLPADTYSDTVAITFSF